MLRGVLILLVTLITPSLANSTELVHQFKNPSFSGIVRHILTGVIDQLSFLRNIVIGLENRISNMNNDIIRIDMTACNVLGIKPDTERIARAKGKIDARSD